MKLKNYSIKIYPLNHTLFLMFLSIFIFTTFNREFSFFGIDLRIIGFGLAALLLTIFFFNKLLNKNIDLNIGNIEKLFFLFYFFVFFSNISWLFNGIEANIDLIKDVVILNIYNFISFLVFALYKKYLTKERVYRLILISCFVLGISIIFIYFKLDILNGFYSEGVRQYSIDSGRGETRNLLGQYIRIAGFAEDANFACLFTLIGLILSKNIKNKFNRFCFILLMLMSIALSFSRTVIIGLILSILVSSTIRMFPKIKNIIIGSFSILYSGFSIILPFLNFNNNLKTVSTRFMLWKRASEIFLKHPILGNGLASFRCYNSSFYRGTWFVQAHSTWWQVISENGIIAFILLIFIFIYVIKRILSRKNSSMTDLIFFILLIFSSTFETIYLQIFILIWYVFGITLIERGEA